MSNFRGGKNGGNFYSNLTQPIRIDCNFIVDSSNGNGLGIRSLKSNGWIRNVFMYTSASAGTNNGYLNPVPAAGYAIIQFKQNFNLYLGGASGFVSPVSGTPINVTSGLTQHDPYIITSVGTTTQAEWETLGLPPGLAPAVGQSFIAITSSAGTGTGVVEAPAAVGSGIQVIDVIGNANASIDNASIAANGGAWVMVRFLAATSSSVTTLVATAPADGSVVAMSFNFDQSSADPIMANGDPVGA